MVAQEVGDSHSLSQAFQMQVVMIQAWHQVLGWHAPQMEHKPCYHALAFGIFFGSHQKRQWSAQSECGRLSRNWLAFFLGFRCKDLPAPIEATCCRLPLQSILTKRFGCPSYL